MRLDSKKLKTAAAATVFGGSLLCTAGLGVAGAEPDDPVGDGLVTVMQGKTTVAEAVTPEEAVAAITKICGSATQETGHMADMVDANGIRHTACTDLPGGDVTVVQNAATEEAPAPPPEVGQGGSPAADESVGSTWDPI